MTDEQKVEKYRRDRFDFLNIRISAENIGHRVTNNFYLTGDTVLIQLDMLLEDYEGYIPIGVCFDEKYVVNYFDDCADELTCFFAPIVMENNDGDRIWIHCPYTQWKKFMELGLI